MRRVYLNTERQGSVICEKCGRVQRIQVAETTREQTIKIACKCHHTFSVRIDQRRHYRKRVSLHGTFERVYPQNSEKGRAIVKDLSQTGVGFLTYAKQKLNANDVLKLKFTLDDPHNSTIDVRGTVKIVNDQYIGVELHRPNEHTQKILGFYLMQVGDSREKRDGGNRQRFGESYEKSLSE
jgi:ribosomal protein S30